MEERKIKRTGSYVSMDEVVHTLNKEEENLINVMINYIIRKHLIQPTTLLFLCAGQANLEYIITKDLIRLGFKIKEVILMDITYNYDGELQRSIIEKFRDIRIPVSTVGLKNFIYSLKYDNNVLCIGIRPQIGGSPLFKIDNYDYQEISGSDAYMIIQNFKNVWDVKNRTPITLQYNDGTIRDLTPEETFEYGLLTLFNCSGKKKSIKTKKQINHERIKVFQFIPQLHFFTLYCNDVIYGNKLFSINKFGVKY